MERELTLLTEDVKHDKEKIELEFEKLKETRNAFSITCEALSDRLSIEINDPFFSIFIKENGNEI